MNALRALFKNKFLSRFASTMEADTWKTPGGAVHEVGLHHTLWKWMHFHEFATSLFWIDMFHIKINVWALVCLCRRFRIWGAISVQKHWFRQTHPLKDTVSSYPHLRPGQNLLNVASRTPSFSWAFRAAKRDWFSNRELKPVFFEIIKHKLHQ